MCTNSHNFSHDCGNVYKTSNYFTYDYGHVYNIQTTSRMMMEMCTNSDYFSHHDGNVYKFILLLA